MFTLSIIIVTRLMRRRCVILLSSLLDTFFMAWTRLLYPCSSIYIDRSYKIYSLSFHVYCFWGQGCFLVVWFFLCDLWVRCWVCLFVFLVVKFVLRVVLFYVLDLFSFVLWVEFVCWHLVLVDRCCLWVVVWVLDLWCVNFRVVRCWFWVVWVRCCSFCFLIIVRRCGFWVFVVLLVGIYPSIIFIVFI